MTDRSRYDAAEGFNESPTGIDRGDLQRTVSVAEEVRVRGQKARCGKQLEVVAGTSGGSWVSGW